MTYETFGPDFGPALQYHEYRPPYAEAAISQAISYANVTRASRILDVGIGTGRLAVPLAMQGLSLCGIDPSPDMISALERTAAGQVIYPIEGTFEVHEFEPESFDLVTCAEAWHWLDRDESFSKAHGVLKPNGTLAILYNELSPAIATKLHGITAMIYSQLDLETPDSEDQVTADEVFSDLNHREDFYAFAHCKYPNPVALSVTEYCGLLSTMSTHRRLPPPQLQQFLATLQATMEREGEQVMLPYRTSLLLAKRA